VVVFAEARRSAGADSSSTEVEMVADCTPQTGEEPQLDEADCSTPQTDEGPQWDEADCSTPQTDGPVCTHIRFESDDQEEVEHGMRLPALSPGSSIVSQSLALVLNSPVAHPVKSIINN